MPRWEPKPYHVKGVGFMIERSYGGVLLDPGMGKTAISLAAITMLKRKGFIKGVLVIAPLRPARKVWPQQAAYWTDFNHLTTQVIHGPEKLAALMTKCDIHVINPEGLAWLLETCKTRRHWPWDVLIVDESTKFKNSQAIRFKALRAVLPKFTRRYILTGTPTPNGFMDLFGQMYIVDCGAALGRYITHYRMTYFEQTGFGGYTYVLRKGADKEILKKIQPHTLRMSSEDYQQLPKVVITNIKVELPAAVFKTYKRMENSFFAELESGRVLAANGGVASGRCREIANGGLYIDRNEGTWEHLHSEKIDAAVDLVEQLQGGGALIAYEFHHDLDRLQKAFPEAPYLGGGVSGKKGDQLIDQWNAGKLPVLLVHPATVAHGLNLQSHGKAIIFHSISWDLDHHQQLIKRLHREGRVEPVLVYNIIAEQTVDEIIANVLIGKEKSQTGLLKELNDYWKTKRVNKI